MPLDETECFGSDQTMNDSLAELLALDLPGSLLVLTHDNPDPDSLSSAWALQYLLREARGIDAAIGYSGIVGRAENRAMLRLLGLEPQKIVAEDVARYDHLALIDAQPHTGNSVVPESRRVDIVIDHHPLRPATADARFFLVRPEVGASATLLASLLRSANIDIPRPLATALLYGIRTETHDLARETSEADREAYHYLFGMADASLLASIATPRLSREYYAHVARALERARRAGGVLVCQLDEVTDPDFVPEMADFFVRMEGLDIVLVYGYVDERMFLSIRSNDPTARAGEMMRALLHGIGTGGGHGMRAGGAVDVARSGMSRNALHGIIEERFLSAHGHTPSELAFVVGAEIEAIVSEGKRT